MSDPATIVAIIAIVLLAMSVVVMGIAVERLSSWASTAGWLKHHVDKLSWVVRDLTRHVPDSDRDIPKIYKEGPSIPRRSPYRDLEDW